MDQKELTEKITQEVVERLHGTSMKVRAVVGFPLGAMDSRAKAFEARTAIANGASEINLVMSVGAMKAGNLKLVKESLVTIRTAICGIVDRVNQLSEGRATGWVLGLQGG